MNEASKSLEMPNISEKNDYYPNSEIRYEMR